MRLSLPQQYNLAGCTALITGAGGLLGPQHAAALAMIGAQVVLSDISEPAAEAAAAFVRSEVADARCLAARLDVRSQDAIKDLNERLRRDVGAIDILVNNAAIDPKVAPTAGMSHSSRLEALSIEQWNLEIAVGLTGPMLCAQSFGAIMAQRGKGVILNIASDLSIIAPDQRLYRRDDTASEPEQPVKPVTYSVIKHGLVGLTKYLATYWADKGVRVNAISPGGVFNNQDPVFVERLTQLIPMGRMAELNEYRSVVQFLCSDASSYMTGQNIVIDGGRTVW